MKTLILRLSGSITIGQGDVQLHRQVEQALNEGYDSLILDFHNVHYLDSSAVGELAACRQLLQDRNGEMALTRLPAKIRKVLQIMSFIELFGVYDSIEDALQIIRNRAKPAAA